MWIRTISSWQFFEVEYTSQGMPILIKPITGKCNYKSNYGI